MASLFDEDESQELNDWFDHEDSDDHFGDAPVPSSTVKVKVHKAEESDEDLKLFGEGKSTETKQNNQKSADEILALAKKRMEKEADVQHKRNRRLLRVQEYYFSKAYVVIQIGRCIQIARRNFGCLRKLIIAQTLSWMYSVPRVRLDAKEKLRNLKSLMMTFNKALRDKLNYDQQCEVRHDYKVAHVLSADDKNEKLNRIEYLQLFNAILQQHGYKTRFL